jgi:hypothetical protein
LHLDDQAILERVEKLHRMVRFDEPPLDLRAVLGLRPDLILQTGEAETPVEIQNDGDRLILTLPICEDPYEERMRLAHALGHALLHPLPVLCEGDWPAEELSLEDPGAADGILRESQAHFFALALLMPLEMFEAHNQLRLSLFTKGEEVDQEVERLVPIFAAPPDAIRGRLHLLMDRRLRILAGKSRRKI